MSIPPNVSDSPNRVYFAQTCPENPKSPIHVQFRIPMANVSDNCYSPKRVHFGRPERLKTFSAFMFSVTRLWQLISRGHDLRCWVSIRSYKKRLKHYSKGINAEVFWKLKKEQSLKKKILNLLTFVCSTPAIYISIIACLICNIWIYSSLFIAYSPVTNISCIFRTTM